MVRWLLVILILIALWCYVMIQPVQPIMARTVPAIIRQTPPAGWDIPEPRHATDPADLSRA